MFVRTARLGVLLVAVVGMLATTTPPASADTVKVGVLAGQATTGPRGYPCTADTLNCDPVPELEVKTGPKGTPWVNLHNFGGAVGFTYVSDICAKVSVGKKTGLSTSCTIFASGTVEGYCGFSSALGTATITNADKGATTVTFKWLDVGGLLVITGRDWSDTAQLNILAYDAGPTPLSGSGSCLTGNGQSFTIGGLFSLIIKTTVP